MSPIEEKKLHQEVLNQCENLLDLDVEQIGFPELDGENSDKTALEKKFNALIVARSDLLKSIFKPVKQTGPGKRSTCSIYAFQ